MARPTRSTRNAHPTRFPSQTTTDASPSGGHSAVSRRQLLRGGLALTGGAVGGAALLAACGSDGGSASAAGGTVARVTYQLAWTGDNGVLGEVVAKRNGWYREQGIDIVFRVGGPSVDPVTLTGSGASVIGQTASSPALMLGRAQGIPVKAFAAGLQKHPYAYISLPENPVRTPHDLVGKTVGTQATGKILLDALLAENKIDPGSVKVEVVGSQVTPLQQGRIDVFTGWLSNVETFRPLGGKYVAMPLWDTGIHLYAYPYLTTDKVLASDPDMVRNFLIATAKGWEYARENPEEAVGLLVQEFPALDRASQLAGAKTLLGYMFTDTTAQGGWGAMEPAVWSSQIATWQKLGQFKGEPPTVDDVMTLDVLNATQGARPKVGAP